MALAHLELTDDELRRLAAIIEARSQAPKGYKDRAGAVEHTCLPVDTLKKIPPSELPRYQPAGPGGKVYYKVTDLDAYMEQNPVI